MLLNLLPEDLVLEYNKQDSDLEINDLMNFLNKQLHSRERTDAHCSKKLAPRKNRSVDSSNACNDQDDCFVTAAELINQNKKPFTMKNSCAFCDGFHISNECRKALKLPIEKRKQILFKKGICFKCVRPRHIARFCKAKVKCSVCGGPHSFILCDSAKCPKFEDNEKNNDSEKNQQKECSLTNNLCVPHVLLQTLVVRLRSKNKEVLARMLVDTGSQRSYISKYAASLMNYEAIGEEKICHSLFGGSEILENHKRYLIHVSDIKNTFHCNFEALDQKTICSEVSRIDISPFVNEIKNRKVFLTDTFHVNDNLIYENSPNEIHILVGADIAGKLFTGKFENLTSGLVCINTRLGWTIIGKTDEIDSKNRNNLALSLHVNNSCISDLWRLDTLGIVDPGETQTKRELEEATKVHFVQTLRREGDGRYEVSLPWIQGHPPLSSCRYMAEKRLSKCVKVLQSENKLEAYEAVFNDWLGEKIIEIVSPLDECSSEHFLPHRAVLKENSTTPIRPVFDGSARDKDSPSINDCLDKGPNIIELLPSIINRFRRGKIGVIADIKKAFLQIGLNKRDRVYLKFLWWEQGDRTKLKIFQHRRVVFGLSCSPYLLGATIEYHLNHVPDYFQLTASKLLESFYVDNCVTSVNNADELAKFIAESQLILSSAKFELRGWEHSGCLRNDKEQNEVKEKKVVVLGLIWNIGLDSLAIDLKEFYEELPTVTKRKILSTVHKIFDPIGFTCPVTLLPKLLLQECWKLKVSWDSELPIDIVHRFENWKKDLDYLRNISIPRCILPDLETANNVTLHVFCDASKLAYATCVYLRSETLNGSTCQLVQARCRVAPIKAMTIPRLELMACTIGARLAQSTKRELGMEKLPTYYWSDSSNALFWIKKVDNWATFVCNRVREIRLLSDPEKWNFLPGSMNPADLPSRGCSAKELAKTKWWEGPQWLKNPIEKWPKSEIFADLDVIEKEKKKSVVSAANTNCPLNNLFDHLSSYEKIISVIAWMFRFSENCRLKKENRISGPLSVSERNHAELTLMKIIQMEAFSGQDDKRLLNLQAFKDNFGIIRIKTRILRRKDEENFRFPIVLPSKHTMVEKLIKNQHEKMKHAGVQFLMSMLREKFWILKARKTIRQVVRKCVICIRYEGKFKKLPIAPLPEDRVREAAIFEIIGIDLAGPLFLKRNEKFWIVIFTCAVFRAVHLELTPSLTTESFLQTLRRFIARRGRPHVIYSDNGTNFVGTSNLFKTIDWDKLSKEATIDKIKWKFIPPSAPWWGGWWERLIGVLKRILRKVLGRTSLEYEELSTILCECESMMNNRPLTYMSDDEGDLIPLTPAMFLHEIREVGVPDFDQLDSNVLNRRLKYRQKLKQDLLKRFRSEYLGQLKQNYQRTKNDKPIEVGDVVLISSDNLKRLNWPLGKVVEVFKAEDGHIRLAKIMTKSGEILRPVTRLLPLEINCLKDQKDLQNRPKSKDIIADLKVPEPTPPCQSLNDPNATDTSSVDTELTTAMEKDEIHEVLPVIPSPGVLKRSRYGRTIKPVQRL